MSRRWDEEHSLTVRMAGFMGSGSGGYPRVSWGWMVAVQSRARPSAACWGMVSKKAECFHWYLWIWWQQDISNKLFADPGLLWSYPTACNPVYHVHCDSILLRCHHQCCYVIGLLWMMAIYSRCRGVFSGYTATSSDCKTQTHTASTCFLILVLSSQSVSLFHLSDRLQTRTWVIVWRKRRKDQSLQDPAVRLRRVISPNLNLQTSVMNLDPQTQSKRTDSDSVSVCW